MDRKIGLGLALSLPLAAWAQFGQSNMVTFDSLDADGNQRIDREEAREEPRLNASFISYDTDGDGTLSRREFARFVGFRPQPPTTSLN